MSTRAPLAFSTVVTLALAMALSLSASSQEGKPAAAQASAAPAKSAHPSTEEPCEACHTEDGWLPARFAHERTGFPLTGFHDKVGCKSCHGPGYTAPKGVGCAGCHRDVHAQEFGLRCEGCHDATRRWNDTLFDVTAHRRTNFPLTGRHAMLPCEECHQNRRDHGFTRAAVACVDCHQDDYERTALMLVNHRRSAFSTDCKACHQPVSYRPAAFPDHESCFPVSTGPHRGVSCGTCHRPSSSMVADGACRTRSAQCASCHQHQCEVSDRIHEEITGYSCSNERCVGCHTR